MYVTFRSRERGYSHRREFIGRTPMSQNHMTHWIEIADERHFWEDAPLNRMSHASESHCLHLGANILKVTSKAGSYALACGRRAFKQDQANVVTHPDQRFIGEPMLSELLHDPMAQALMTADHVDRRQLDTLLDAARRKLPR
jgi:hypothetical protein